MKNKLEQTSNIKKLLQEQQIIKQQEVSFNQTTKLKIKEEILVNSKKIDTCQSDKNRYITKFYHSLQKKTVTQSYFTQFDLKIHNFDKDLDNLKYQNIRLEKSLEEIDKKITNIRSEIRKITIRIEKFNMIAQLI